MEQSKTSHAEENRSPAGCPEVIVDFIFEEGLFYIAVENIGNQPALKVSVRFKPKFSGVGGQVAVSALPLFENIEFLAPQKSIRTFLDTSARYFQRDEPSRITAQVSYYDRENHHYLDTIHHDLSIYQDIGYIRYTPDSKSLQRDI